MKVPADGFNPNVTSVENDSAVIVGMFFYVIIAVFVPSPSFWALRVLILHEEILHKEHHSLLGSI